VARRSTPDPLGNIVNPESEAKEPNPGETVPEKPVAPGPSALLPVGGATSEAAEFFAAYEGHAKTLRTWLVAYGIGAPVFLVREPVVWKPVTESGFHRFIILLYLVGASLQVGLAALNKSAMWACYFGEKYPEYQLTQRYKVGSWISDKYSIDVVVDAIAIGVYVWATYLAFTRVAP
jgi:hypothetical protein